MGTMSLTNDGASAARAAGNSTVRQAIVRQMRDTGNLAGGRAFQAGWAGWWDRIQDSPAAWGEQREIASPFNQKRDGGGRCGTGLPRSAHPPARLTPQPAGNG